ncbi:ATP-binding protein [uncultured Winogradskyella sp.]|uniref:ATP-binding response regulator n=1 Tax=uncultured Winogradskyella sp. TaxID=395353 RepID=UPI002615F22B|nr:ATP-binding protein [uncultured Winogradskyella sp.]
MNTLKQLRSLYLEENTQFILTSNDGKILESDHVLFLAESGKNIEEIHLFFTHIFDSIEEGSIHFSCVHFNIEDKKLICDITIKKIIDSDDFLIIISDFSKHYNSFHSLTQSRNETAINAELLAQDNLNLSRKEAIKNKFIANFNHEIVSPIQSILTFTGMLKKTSLSTTHKEYLDILSNSSDVLKSMANDIFDISLIETGNLQINKTRFSLKKLINLLSAEYSKKCAEVGLTFVTEYDAEMPTYVVSDKFRIQQIVKNLLNNALKYSDAGSISLVVKPVYKRARKITFSITVNDTGIGIPKEHHETIFRSFTRLEQSKNTIGNGLGLTLAKELAELLDSKITLESEVGKGSSFSVTVRATTPLTEQKKIISESNSENKEILLVENNPNDQLSIFKMIAQHKPYFLDIAPNGEQAIELCKKKSYDLILMDYKMDGLTGLETAKVINSKNKTPIVIITGFKIDKNTAKLYNGHYDSILHKPFDEESLIEHIELHIK